MPKKLTEADSKDKWNFYFPRLLKLKMHHKLLSMNLQKRQSALLRALVIMFVEGELPEDRVKTLIEQETYITETNKTSSL